LSFCREWTARVSLFRPFVAASKDDLNAIVIRYPTDKRLDHGALTAWVSSQLPTDGPFIYTRGRDQLFISRAFATPQLCDNIKGF